MVRAGVRMPLIAPLLFAKEITSNTHALAKGELIQRILEINQMNVLILVCECTNPLIEGRGCSTPHKFIAGKLELP